MVCRSWPHTLSQEEYLEAARGWEFPPIPDGVPAGAPLTLSVDEVAVADEKSAMYTYLAGKVLRGIGRKAEAKQLFQVGGDVRKQGGGAGEAAWFGPIRMNWSVVFRMCPNVSKCVQMCPNLSK